MRKNRIKQWVLCALYASLASATVIASVQAQTAPHGPMIRPEEIHGTEQASYWLLHVGTMRPEQKRQTQHMIDQRLKDYTQSNDPYFKVWFHTVHGWIDPTDDMLVLDVTSREVAQLAKVTGIEGLTGIEISDHLHGVAASILVALLKTTFVTGCRVTIDGVPIEQVYPDYFQSDTGYHPANVDDMLAAQSSNPVMVVSAGHGYRRLYNVSSGKYTWGFQRDPAQGGVIEDLLTPIHATELAKWLKLRSKVDVAFSRSQSSDPYPNPDKLKAKWLEMAACTNLQALYPDQHSLWGSDDQKKMDKLRDAHSDLYARRSFAN